MKKLKRKSLSVLLLIAMCFTLVIPSAAMAADSSEQGKMFYGASPSIFNPHNGQTTKLYWNFQYSHNAYVKVLQGDTVVRTIQESKRYPGDFVGNEETWDGKDDQGNIVPNGNYIIVIDTIGDEWSGRYPRRIPVSVLDRPAEDIAIAPNLIGDEFMVYGGAEENTVDVEVFVDGASEGMANLGPGIWTKTIEIGDYDKVRITAIKTILVPVEVTDEDGNVSIEYVEEEIDLGPLNVLKHIVRPFDRFTDLARYYYGDSDKYIDIIRANRLEYPYVVSVEARLLVLEPSHEGEPPKSEFTDPELMELKCGIVDLLSGKTEFTKEPINFATGNYVSSFDDITVDGSFPITFSRFYNSRDRYNGDLGMNWHHNYEYRLQDMGRGTVQIIFSDGHRENYTLQADGSYEATSGNYNQLIKSGNNYILITTDLKKYYFNELGQLISIIDSNGNTTTFSYENLLLREIRTASGYLLIQYYTDGRIREISDNTGRSASYGYHGDDLSAFTDPLGNEIEYRYDGEQRLIEMISPLKTANITNVYDSKGRVVEQTLPDGNKYYFTYDDTNRTTTYTEPNGNKVIYKYNEDFIITEISYSDSPRKKTFNSKGELSSFTDKNGYTYSYQYDEQGNVTAVTDPLLKTTTYTYDQNRKVTSINLPDGSSHKFTYDHNGNMLTATDPVNRTTAFRYDQQGLPISITQPDGSVIQMNYDSPGNVTEMIDPLGNTSKFSYDSLNRVKTITDANGNTTQLDYTKDNKIAKVTDALGNTAIYKYNANGTLVEIKDPNNKITKYKYNNADQLIEIVDPLMASTQYEYDVMGNVNKVVDANGGVTTYSYDQLNRLGAITDPELYTARYEYDSNDNLISIIDPRGNKTQLFYDALNRLQKVIDAKQAATSYEYDAIGKVTRVIDALNYVTEYQYYDDGRVKTIIDPLGNTTSFAYNTLGLVETVTDARGYITTYQYNSLGNLIKMVDAKGALLTGSMIKTVMLRK